MPAIHGGFFNKPTPRGARGMTPSHWLLCPPKKCANSPFIDFTPADFDWAQFDRIEFQCVGMRPVSNGVVFAGRVSEDGGGTFKSGVSDYLNAWDGFDSGGSVMTVSGVSSAMNFTDVATGQSNIAVSRGNFVISVQRPFDVVYHKMWRVISAYRSNVGAPNLVTGNGSYEYGTTQGAQNAVRFFYTTGNIEAGEIYAYGYPRSD